MASEKEINKVQYGDTVFIDLTGDTATQSDVINNKTFHLSNGKIVQGTCTYTVDDSEADAEAKDVLRGKYFASGGHVKEGTMDKVPPTAEILSVSGSHEYQIPQGYHDGTGVVSVELEAKSATPETSAQTIKPTNGKVLSRVTVAAIPSQYKDTTNVDATSDDVLKGKVIVTADGEIEGTMPDNAPEEHILDATTNNQLYRIPAGRHDGTGTVKIELEPLTVTPKETQQPFTPPEGKVYGKVTVNAIPAKYGDTTGDNATAAALLTGRIAHTIKNGVATKIEGTMVNIGKQTITISNKSDSKTISKGYHNGNGVAAISSEQQAMIVPENIREGATILGVDGAYDGQDMVSAAPLSVTPTVDPQEFTPQESGKKYNYYSKVNVAAIPSRYKDTTNVTATENDVLLGKKFVTQDGEKQGAMPDNGAVNETLTADVDKRSFKIPKGYHDGNGTINILGETKVVTPTETQKELFPAVGRVITKIIALPIPENYKDTTNVTATENDVLKGKIIVTQDGQKEGVIPEIAPTAQTLSVSGEQEYQIPQGYHDGTGTVSIELEAKSATPKTSAQTIKPTDGKVLSQVTVAKIPTKYKNISGVTATAADVIAGLVFVSSAGSVTGTMPDNTPEEHTLDATTNNQLYRIPAGRHDGTGTVKIELEPLTVTPEETQQPFTPPEGKVYGSVTVNAIPARYGDTTGDTATAAALFEGRLAHTIKNGVATQIEGTMHNNGKYNIGIVERDERIQIPKGYHNGNGVVGITSAQQQLIVPGNIREGATILGIDGTYDGSDVVGTTTLEVTPSVDSQIWTPEGSKKYNYYSQVNVKPIPYSEEDNSAGGKTVKIASTI